MLVVSFQSLSGMQIHDTTEDLAIGPRILLWLIRITPSPTIYLDISEHNFIFSGNSEHVITHIWSDGKFLITEENEIVSSMKIAMDKFRGLHPVKPLVKVRSLERALSHPEKIPIAFYLCKCGAREVVFEE